MYYNENYEAESNKIEYGIYGDYDISEIIDETIPEPDFDYVSDLPF